MKYMGSKNRYAKYILPIILKHRTDWYVEPFVGGANIIDKVGGNRMGADVNPYVIEALKLIRDTPHTIPDLISEDDYEKAKKEMHMDGMTGFTGFAMSFGGKWFGGYRRDKAGTKGNIENMRTQTRRSKQAAYTQSPKLEGVILEAKHYLDLSIPSNSIIYCDPPYANTTKYKGSFDHAIFWNWVREKSKYHKVYVSEYTAPDDFNILWEKPVNSNLDVKSKGRQRVERLYSLDFE